MKFKYFLLYSIVIVLLFLAGCGKSDEQQEEQEQEEKIQIGMIFDNFVMERWLRDRDVFVSAAKELGAEVNVQNANGSVEEQVELIDYFIQNKMDVIVIIPVDSKPLLSAVKRAQEEGIKVISYDRLIVGAEPDLYISFDNKKVGTLMGEALSEVLTEEDKVLMICGPVTDNNVSEVQEGFEEVMEESGIEILDIYHADEWKAEYASTYIREHSDLARSVRAVMCGNDNLSGGAISALAELRLAGEVMVTGQDADLEACQRIVEGTQYMTVYKPIEKLAAKAAQATVALVLGEELEYEDYLTEEGKTIPYIKLDPISVDAVNMQEVIIDSGFHLAEDVYLNRPELIE